MLQHVGTLVPTLMTFGFFAIDLSMTLFGIMFSAVIHVQVNWVGRGLHFVFRKGVRRVLLVITLPCLILGLFLELSATFF